MALPTSMLVTTGGHALIVTTGGSTSVVLRPRRPVEGVQRATRRACSAYRRSAGRDERVDLPLLHGERRQLLAHRRERRRREESACSRFTLSGSTVDAATELFSTTRPSGAATTTAATCVSPTTAPSSSASATVAPAARSPTRPSQPPERQDPAHDRDGSIPRGQPARHDRRAAPPGPPGSPTVCGEIWADGLRNLFRLGFDVSLPAQVPDQDVVRARGRRSTTAWPARTTAGRAGRPGVRVRRPCRTPMTSPCCTTTTRAAATSRPAACSSPRAHGRQRRRVPVGRFRLRAVFPRASPARPASRNVSRHGDAGNDRSEFFDVGSGFTLFYTTYADGGELHRRHRLACTSRAGPMATLGGLPRRLRTGRDRGAPGRLDVFVTGTDGQLWHKWYHGGWSGWEPSAAITDGAPPPPPGPPAASTSSPTAPTASSGTSGTRRLVRLGSPRRRSSPMAPPPPPGPPAASTSSSTAPTASSGTSGTKAAGPAGKPSAAASTDGPAAALGRRPPRRLRQWHRRPALAQVVRRRLVRLGGPRRHLADGPATAGWAPGRLDVVVRGADGRAIIAGTSVAGRAGKPRRQPRRPPGRRQLGTQPAPHLVQPDGGRAQVVRRRVELVGRPVCPSTWVCQHQTIR